MEIKKYNNWLEIYGVKPKDPIIATLKSKSYKRYPPKQCWTKYGGQESDIIDNVDVNSNVSDELEKYKQENTRLKELIAKLEAGSTSNTSNKKAPAKKTNLASDIKKFIGSGKTLPILSRYTVSEGKLYATDIEKFISVGTSMNDGVYKSIDPVVLDGKMEVSEAPSVPKPYGDYVSIDADTMLEINYAISKYKKFVNKKNYAPVMTGIYISGNRICFSDSICYITYTLGKDTGLNVNIPVTNICSVEVHKGDCKWYIREQYMQIVSDIYTTGCVTLIPNYPDIHKAGAISGKSFDNTINTDVDNITNKVKIAKANDERHIMLNDELGINIKYISLLADTISYDGMTIKSDIGNAEIYIQGYWPE